MKRLLSLFLWAVLLAVSGPALAVESTGSPVSASFSSSTAEILNPERGWYAWPGSQNCDGVQSADMNSLRGQGYSLTLCILRLDTWRTTATLPSTPSDVLDAAAAKARTAGIKIIVRPAYNYDNNSGGGLDATLSITLGHVSQLAPAFQRNADVFVFPQAGFFGPYGEFWSGGGTAAIVRSDSDRAALISALLAAWHPRSTIQLRYPANLFAQYPSQLTALMHATGSAQSRLGFHQDCILADDTEGGTYTSLTDAKRTRVKNDALYVPYGGETCNYTQSTSRKSCADALGLGDYHITFLNRSYDNSFYENTSTNGNANNWTANGCYAQFTRSMGYRFRIVSISHQGAAVAGQTLTFRTVILNEGWARIFREQRVQICLMTGNTCTASAMSPADLRKLAPNATTGTPITVPGLVAPAAGTYPVQICMPDVWVTTGSDIRYNVRPANTNSGSQAWNTTTGCWATGTSVVVN